jgi:methyltransferase OMS1
VSVITEHIRSNALYDLAVANSESCSRPQAPSMRRPIRKGPFIVGSLAIWTLSFYGFYLYKSYQKSVSDSQALTVPLDVSDRYNKTASSYDADIDTMEKVMGLTRRRRQLVKQTTGHVLEVSVGTGRNMEYYKPKECESLTFVDISPGMMEIAREKFKKLYPLYPRARFLTQSAIDPIRLPSPEGFDTIIQTMGLCSTPDPEGLLKNLGKMVNQQSGRILLLEHGISRYAWLNRMLDHMAPAHADKHGCWWNKDIGAIVERSGLRVIGIKRYHFGTTWKVELRPAIEDSKEVQVKS